MNIGNKVTAQDCYAVAANADGDGESTWKATLFSAGVWPKAAKNLAWTASPDADGTENKYWKSLGGWNGGMPEYPTLWWE